MTWQALRVKIALGLLVACIAVNCYGIVALLLLGYDITFLLGYMGLAALAIPTYALAHMIAPAASRRKIAAERNSAERIFVRLYNLNLRLAGGVWVAILVVLALKKKG